MKNRIIGLLLALLLLVSLVPLSAAAEENHSASLAVSVSPATVFHSSSDQEVTVTVGVSAGVAALDLRLSSTLDLKSAAAAPDSPVDPDGGINPGAKSVQVTFYQSGDLTTQTQLFTATFTVPASTETKQYPITVEVLDARCWSEGNSEPPVTIPDYNGSINVTHDLAKTAAVPATCADPGTKEYWTCSLCGKKFADADGQKEIQAPETVPALGHDWSAAWTWTPAAGGFDAAASLTCSRCPDTPTVNASVTRTSHQDASCTMGTVDTYEATAVYDGRTFTDTRTEDDRTPLGHQYKLEWNWEVADLHYPQFRRVCERCSDASEWQTVQTPAEEKVFLAPTCSSPGELQYTAKVTAAENDGNEAFSEPYSTAIPASGHSWGAPTWSWTGNDADGYTATAAFVCASDPGHTDVRTGIVPVREVTDATCDEAGRTTYTATVTGPDGTVYTTTGEDVKTVESPMLSHEWTVSWSWTGSDADGYAAAATFTCPHGRNGSHSVGPVDAVVTSASDGSATVYTATIAAEDAPDDYTGSLTDTKLPYLPGDIDGNGSVSIADVSLLAKYVKYRRFGGITDYYVEAALDVDGNGSVSIADVSRLATFVKAIRFGGYYKGEFIIIY